MPVEKSFKTLKDMIFAHSFLSPLQFFKVGEIMTLAKYEQLMLPGASADKVTPDNDFTDQAVVQCGILVLKHPLVGDGNLHMIKNTF